MKRSASIGSQQDVQTSSGTHKLSFRPLGSGREVGRSCHLLEFMGKTIMFDCGIHPAKSSEEALPYLGYVDNEIDLLLVTHFHLDHIAALPYITEHSELKIKNIYMTRPTRSVGMMLLSDYVRVSGGSTDGDVLYTEKDVEKSFSRCRVIDFHQEIQVDGINITCYNAGHVLGACMFLVEISGVRILYTGDYSREDDRHLMGAEIPRIHPDILIVESTFGVQTHESATSREERFTSAVHNTVKRGGRCLLPVFSLGRAQELCLILEEYWDRHPELQGVPIYHVSQLAAKSLKVYQAFISYMNNNVQTKSRSHNPWLFNHISSYKSTQDFAEEGPAVVMASPGMLQNGPSRRLFEAWSGDKRNSVIIAGYSVEGTLAKKILNDSTKDFLSLSGRRLPLNCEVKLVSFAAHSDFVGTFTFIQQVLPKHVILVHGENAQMRRLRDELVSKCGAIEATKEMDFYNPDNGEEVAFNFERDRVVRVIGALAADTSNMDRGTRLQGILVRRNFDEQLLHPEDVPRFTQLNSTVITQRIHVPFHSTFERLKSCIGQLFENEVVETFDRSGLHGSDADNKSAQRIVVHGSITITHMGHRALLTWPASPTNDMVADAIIALMAQADGGIPAVRDSSCCSMHAVQSLASGDSQEEGCQDEHPSKVRVASNSELDLTSLDGQTMSLVANLLKDKYGAKRVRVDLKCGKINILAESPDTEAKGPIAVLDMSEATVDTSFEEVRATILELLEWSRRVIKPVPALPAR